MTILETSNVPESARGSAASEDLRKALDQKSLFDWSESHDQRFTHDFFKFPGKFHPPIVENILRRLSPGAVVDPMAGVGTVAVEAKAAGIPSLSIDVDPVSVFFARVKTTPLARATLDEAWSDLEVAIRAVRRPRTQVERFKFEDVAESTMRRQLAEVGASHLAEYTYWFRRYALVDYARLDHAIVGHGLAAHSALVRRFFRACLLSTVRRISNADPSPVSGLEITSHMKKRIEAGYEIDVFVEFVRRVQMNLDRMEAYHAFLREEGTLRTVARVVRGDAADVAKLGLQLGPTDLILFSPPYCNAIEYWRRHQLEYFVGGFLTRADIPEHNLRYVGRRTLALGRSSATTPTAIGVVDVDRIIGWLHGTGRAVKAWQLWLYFTDMASRLRAFFGVLAPGGRAVVIVGDSRAAGELVPTAAALTQLAARIGFDIEISDRYSIRNRSMQFPLRTGEEKIAEESILVLRKPTAPRRRAGLIVV